MKQRLHEQKKIADGMITARLLVEPLAQHGRQHQLRVADMFEQRLAAARVVQAMLCGHAARKEGATAKTEETAATTITEKATAAEVAEDAATTKVAERTAAAKIAEDKSAALRAALAERAIAERVAATKIAEDKSAA